MSAQEPPSRDATPGSPSSPTTSTAQFPAQPTPPPPSSLSSASPPPPPRSQPGQQPTLTEALTSIKPSDFLTIHQAPCVRPGLLTGIGVGAAVGAIRWIMGLPIPRAANWAVGTGLAAAAGRYEYCQFQRRQEREKVRRVVQVYAEKQAKEKREKEERERREREAREKEEAERRKGWWKFW
ncbi:hypothetical protein VTJ83DRAFT_6066 [Remersonia thermophila]|uniref:Cytochrome c oxidase assembly protein COX20, mitochondrial n=1 Tax=Remersonia thermophila TaxID=72144 RepID=A0ABR4DAS1_9PEZI